MIEAQTLLERPLDPIEDVRREFERVYTNDYFNPINGDWISDDYFRIIDLTTKDGSLSEAEMGKLDRSITRLNGKYTHIQKRLGESSLAGAYNAVAEQINAINEADTSRIAIPRMQSAPLEESV